MQYKFPTRPYMIAIFFKEDQIWLQNSFSRDSSGNHSHVTEWRISTLQSYLIVFERDCNHIWSDSENRLQSYLVSIIKIIAIISGPALYQFWKLSFGIAWKLNVCKHTHFTVHQIFNSVFISAPVNKNLQNGISDDESLWLSKNLIDETGFWSCGYQVWRVWGSNSPSSSLTSLDVSQNFTRPSADEVHMTLPSGASETSVTASSCAGNFT